MIDCSNLEMSTFPSSLPLIPKQSYKVLQSKSWHLQTCVQISLNMTGNRLHNLSHAVEAYTRAPTNLTNFQNITKLILTGNNMAYFSHECLRPEK